MLLQGNSASIAQKSSEIWTVQADLQPNSFKSDRLLATSTGRQRRDRALANTRNRETVDYFFDLTGLSGLSALAASSRKVRRRVTR